MFKDILTRIRGFRFIAEQIPLSSSAGRRLLYHTPFVSDRKVLEMEYDRIEQLINRLYTGEAAVGVRSYTFGLEHLKDIRTTLERLSGGYVLGDIELFEIKELALLAGKVRQALEHYGLDVVSIPDLKGVADVLDPEHSGIAQFYVYNAYSAELAEVREAIRKEKDDERLAGLRSREQELEDEVRERLSGELSVCGKDLSEALEQMARLDVLSGKAKFAVSCGLTKPVFAEEKIVYTGLRHLEVEHQLARKGACFQPVSVSVISRGTVVTGANMAGKSVLLKSLMLAQYMAQLGMWVPAAQAEILPVDEVLVCMGDEQDEQRGLSSFAAEMMSINAIIAAVREGKRVLALVDEPARTTNPVEGTALVEALVDFLNRKNVLAMVTTHYSGLEVACRHLRVKGFIEEKVKDKLSLDNINNFLDYTLVEDEEETVPHEAIRIAEILGVDKELIDNAKIYLKTNDAEK